MNRTTSITDDRGLVVLMALGKLNKHVYAGTFSHAEKTRRRAAEQVARVSRRAYRAAA